MLQKIPKPAYRKYLKRGAAIIFITEAIAFATSYGVWYRLNSSQDFRLYMYKNYSSILEGYYKVGELASGSTSPRQTDLAVWKVQGKI